MQLLHHLRHSLLCLRVQATDILTFSCNRNNSVSKGNFLDDRYNLKPPWLMAAGPRFTCSFVRVRYIIFLSKKTYISLHLRLRVDGLPCLLQLCFFNSGITCNCSVFSCSFACWEILHDFARVINVLHQQSVIHIFGKHQSRLYHQASFRCHVSH